MPDDFIKPSYRLAWDARKQEAAPEAPMPGDKGYVAPPGVIPSPMSSKKDPHDKIVLDPWDKNIHFRWLEHQHTKT